MTTVAEPLARAPILRVLGWVLLVVAALSLAAASHWVPFAHFGTIATGPTDTGALVRSFNLSWGLSVLLLGAVYVVGIVLARAPRAFASLESTDGARESAALRMATTSLGAGLLAIAGVSLAVCVTLFREVPVGVSAVTGIWSAILVLFVTSSLWGTFLRSLGLALVSAGLVLTLFVVFIASAIVGPTGLETVERLIKDVAIDKGGAGLLGSVSWSLESLPMATAGLLLIGLPLLMASRGRFTGGSVASMAVAVLFICSSLALPQTMSLVALMSPPSLPGVAFSSLTMILPPPPPPPPPPPDMPPGAVAGSTLPAAANPSAAFPPPPPPAPRSPAAAPVRVGGSVRAPKKVKDAAPVTPAIARAAKIQGVVILEITIGAAGTVTDAKILRSIPLLDQAAIDSVRQWQFEPPLVNGKPAAVVMAVTVTFKE
jgi:TonB family protein